MNEDEKKIYKDRASAKVKELHAARKKLQHHLLPNVSPTQPVNLQRQMFSATYRQRFTGTLEEL